MSDHSLYKYELELSDKVRVRLAKGLCARGNPTDNMPNEDCEDCMYDACGFNTNQRDEP